MTTANTSPRRAPRWVLIALALSLAANLFLAGLIGGHAVLGDRTSEIGTPEERRLGKQILMSLSEDVRPQAREMFGEIGQLRRADRVSRAQASLDVYDALEATPFDQALFVSAQQRVLDMRAAHHSAVQQRVRDFVTTLGPEDRVALAEVLRARSARRIERLSQ